MSVRTAADPGGNTPRGPVPIRDAARTLGISERHLARLVSAGRVRTIRLGRRVLVPHAELVRLCDRGCDHV